MWKRKLTLNIESRRYLGHREKMKDNEIGEIKENSSLKKMGRFWSGYIG